MMTRLKRRVIPRSRRRGFTLVELLVVITIIGMLMALLFPAMSGVMDTVKLTQCGSAMSGLGKGVAAYQAANGNMWPVVSSKPVDCLPAAVPQRAVKKGATGPAPPEAGYGWLVKLLPYLDQRNLYDEISSASSRFQTPAFHASVSDPGASGGKRHLSTKNPQILKCPAYTDPPGALPMVSEAPEYADFNNASEGYGVGITNFVAISGTHLSAVLGTGGSSRTKGAAGPRPNGTIVYRAKDMGTKAIPDGETQTIVASETREPNYASWYDGTTSWVVGADPNGSDPELVAQGNKEVIECRGTCTHAINIGPDYRIGTFYRAKGAKWAGAKDWQYGPSSQHTGGVNHLFGDKHVKALQPTIDSTVYMQLITTNGRETIDGGSF